MSARILIVDDSMSDRFIIKNKLEEYSVLMACDGLEAMQLLDENIDVDLIILDLNIPNIDGLQLLTELKSHKRYNKLRTIILSNHDEVDNEIKCLKLGAVDYIRKPINLDSLKARIDVHVKLLQIQKLLESDLYEKRLNFDIIFNQAPIGIAISWSNDTLIEESNYYFNINPMFEKIIGRSQEELSKLGWGKITHPDDLDKDLKNYKMLMSGEVNSYSMEKRYIKPDGSVVWVHMVVAPIYIGNDHKYNHICLVQNITMRKKIEAELLESERSKSVLLSHLPGLAYRCNYDLEWTMQYVSAGCLELTGYTIESLLYNKELSYNDLISPKYQKSLWKEWERVLPNRLPFKYEYEIITANGEMKWVLEMGQGIYNDLGVVEALEGIILDISERKEIENSLKYNNEHDICTGLYNRTYLENLLKNDSNCEAKNNSAVVGINLSAIHSLNLIYGFHYAQELLKKVAIALNLYCTHKVQLFNTYENRFVFYIKDYKDKTEVIEFCESITKTLNTLLIVEKISGGIGVVEINQDNENDVDQLLKNLLIASEKAINNFDGDFNVSFFNKEMEAEIIREEDIKYELTKIAEGEDDGGLFLQFQPILDLQSNQICGFEALARLKSEKLGLVPPLEFIPITEKTKLIIPIGLKIIRQAFHFLNKLKEVGYHTITVSINISAIQLLKKDFTSNLFEMINEMKVSAENIGIEITESVFSADYEEFNRTLGELKDFGITIAIDDFGTGYSSLARERELNVNCLKVDKYFIDKLLTLKEEVAITSDIISMAHKLGHYVIAEGVEYEIQREYLLNSGCDKIQGYLISKPLDEDAAIELLRKGLLTCAKL